MQQESRTARRGESPAGAVCEVSAHAREVAQVISLRHRVPISRSEWVRRILHEARLTPGSAEFEAGFARHLHRLLGEAGFAHTAAALLAAARDLSAQPGRREEYDALVDTGLALLVRRSEED